MALPWRSVANGTTSITVITAWRVIFASRLSGIQNAAQYRGELSTMAAELVSLFLVHRVVPVRVVERVLVPCCDVDADRQSRIGLVNEGR